MQPTPHDDPPGKACRDDERVDARVGEALDWIVRLNRRRLNAVSEAEAEARALKNWCARSAAHAQAWREAVALWQLLLPAARCMPQRAPRRNAACRPLIARTARDIRISDRSVDTDAVPDTSLPHYRSRQSWS
jgi:ferric-dicitrate binding protein FerR (iron transport regulator)